MNMQALQEAIKRRRMQLTPDDKQPSADQEIAMDKNEKPDEKLHPAKGELAPETEKSKMRMGDVDDLINQMESEEKKSGMNKEESMESPAKESSEEEGEKEMLEMLMKNHEGDDNKPGIMGKAFTAMKNKYKGFKK